LGQGKRLPGKTGKSQKTIEKLSGSIVQSKAYLEP